jgi:protein-disulfide isomerase
VRNCVELTDCHLSVTIEIEMVWIGSQQQEGLMKLKYTARKGRSLLVTAIAFVTLLASIHFDGSVTCLYASDSAEPVFGEGSIHVRLYTDYFCSHCRKLESEAEPLIADLVGKKIITIRFIDTPFFELSSLYAQYSLFAIGKREDLEYTFAVRRTLIEAAREKLDRGKLEEFLKRKGFTFKPFNTKRVFDVWTAYSDKDGIRSTPTCAIEGGGKTEKYTSRGSIIKALKKLLEQESPR